MDDEGAPVDDLDQDAVPEEPPPLQQSEVVNLVTQLTPDEQKQIGQRVVRDFDSDNASRRDREKRRAKWYALFSSAMKGKTFPFQNAANVNLPPFAQAVLQTSGRIWDMLYPANGRIIYAIASSPESEDRAQIVEEYGNFYLRYKVTEWGGSLSDTCHQVVLFGDAIRRVYWDAAEERVVSASVPEGDFVVAYSEKSSDPHMRDVARYTLIERWTPALLEGEAEKGTFVNVEKATALGVGGDVKVGEVRQTANIVDGQQPSQDEQDEDRPRVLLSQHRRWRFPKDARGYPFDGRYHPVAIVVEQSTQTVLRLILREQEDPADLSRYLDQKEELAGFLQASQAWQQQMQQMQQMQSMGGMGPPSDIGTIGPQMPMQGPPMQLGPPPTPPQWYTGEEPRPPRRVETTEFIHYRLFSGEGFYGLGLGDFLGPLAEAINTIINQHLNWLALRNSPPGIIDRQTKMQRGAINCAPGELVEVDALNGDINKVIQWLKIPDSDRSTFAVLQMLVSMLKDLAGMSEIMSGEGTGANRTAKEAMILAEQSLKQLSIAERKVGESLKAEIDDFLRRLAVFLPEDELAHVVGTDGRPKNLRISRRMFLEDAHVHPACDPRTKVERTQEATNLYGFTKDNPMLAQNPMILRKVTEEVLRAFDAHYLIPLLPNPQQPPPGPPPARPYWDEQADFLRDKDTQVHPDDNDEEHLAGHLSFAQTPPAQALSKEGRDMLERHIRWHYAAQMQKAMRQVLQRQQPALMGPQGAMSNGAPNIMAGPPGPGSGGPPPTAGPPVLPPMAGGRGEAMG